MVKDLAQIRLHWEYFPINFARFLLLLAVCFLTKIYRLDELFFGAVIVTSASLLYLLLETSLNLSQSKPELSYVVTGLDLCFIMGLVYSTGMNSFFLSGLVYATAISTENVRIHQGKFSVIFASLIHLLLILLLFTGAIPYIDLYEDSPNMNQLNVIIAFIGMFIINYLVYSVVNTLRNQILKRNQELENERNKIKVSYDLINEDLVMARKFQSKLIPMRNPNHLIHSIYHPMMHVGGDFYDFIQFRDPSKVGIFISDVSGHGVSAALITSMIKTSISQSGDRKETPAMLLSYLNDVLFDESGDYFITAFYGIYNMLNGHFLYSNAGHDWPLLIQDDKIVSLSGVRAAPLAIFPNEELPRLKKTFENSECKLANNDKLFFYTDGVTEVRKNSETKTFLSNDEFIKMIDQSKNLRGADFTQSVYKSLIEYRGNDQFEDDLLMISLEA